MRPASGQPADRFTQPQLTEENLLDTIRKSLAWPPTLVLALAPALALAQDDALSRASRAMGAEGLQSIKSTGEGIGYTFGQAYRPGEPWPRIRLHSFTRTVNFETGAMRDEIVLSRNEPLGGGGYPHTGQQRNDQYVSGNFAWNQLATAPLPGARFVADRVHQLWITPHGVIKAAQRNKATVKAAAGGGSSVSFSEPGRFSATVLISPAGLVEQVSSRVTDPVLGETDAVTVYSDYRDVGGGVKFPGRIRQSQGGHPTLDLTVREVQPNAPADFPVPDLVRQASERVTADKVADGVWFIGGGSHNSVAIEMKDHLVLVEVPLFDGRTLPVIEAVRKLAPGKPIRYVINSHGHFDHSGGLRAAVAEGATVVTQAGNKAYFERAFATPNRIAPDSLARSGKKARFLTVGDKATLSDGNRRIDIYRIADSHHSDTFLMVHLPRERLLIEADAYTPGAPNTPPAAVPNPNHTNLVENLGRLKLDVERILPLHGRVVPVGELYTAAGAKPM
jgi:glyoxylase-like metal-dependent hydrolase (beta-lactamase superfamily II)